MTLAGELRVGLRLADGVIRGLEVHSTRPDVARSLLSGKSVSSVLAGVPLLFAVCNLSQAAAAQLALAAACQRPTQEVLATAPAAAAAETLRDSAFNLLLRWPGWLGESPAPAHAAMARALVAWGGAAEIAAHGAPPAADGTPAAAAPLPDAVLLQACAQAVFGSSAGEWLARHEAGWPALQAWVAAGATPAARVLASLQQPALHGVQAQPVAPLPAPTAAWLLPVARQALAAPGFTAAPLLQGRPAETGPLARWLASTPALQASSAVPNPLQQRALARLWHFGRLLQGQAETAAGCAELEPGTGVGWVDSPRGLLLHVAQVQGQRVLQYRIVAPTDWNMHPQGPLAALLLGAPAQDAAQAIALASACLRVLDPCVPWQVEVVHA